MTITDTDDAISPRDRALALLRDARRHNRATLRGLEITIDVAPGEGDDAADDLDTLNRAGFPQAPEA